MYLVVVVATNKVIRTFEGAEAEQLAEAFVKEMALEDSLREGDEVLGPLSIVRHAIEE